MTTSLVIEFDQQQQKKLIITKCQT